MSGTKKRTWILRKPALLAAIGVVGAAFVVAYIGIHHGLQFASSETQSGAPASTFAVNSADPKPLSTVPDQANNQAADAQNGAATNTAPSSISNQQAQPFEKPDSTTDPCPSEMATAQRDYNTEVQKAKDSLDQTLSFIVGLNISSQYVTNYNTKVTGIFNKYLGTAQSENCTWPVKAPATLPLTYTLH